MFPDLLENSDEFSGLPPPVQGISGKKCGLTGVPWDIAIKFDWYFFQLEQVGIKFVVKCYRVLKKKIKHHSTTSLPKTLNETMSI